MPTDVGRSLRPDGCPKKLMRGVPRSYAKVFEPPKEAHRLKVQKRRKRDAEEELFKNRCVMPGDV